jgi:hypothetical protein
VAYHMMMGGGGISMPYQGNYCRPAPEILRLKLRLTLFACLKLVLSRTCQRWGILVHRYHWKLWTRTTFPFIKA